MMGGGERLPRASGHIAIGKLRGKWEGSQATKQPGVLQVVPSQTYQLHGSGAGTQGGHAGTTHTMGLM